MTYQPTAPAAPPFMVSARGRVTRKREGGPPALNNRMRRMISLMVFGHEDDPEHTLYSIEDASRAVGYRVKAGRALIKTAIFTAALNEAVDRKVRYGIEGSSVNLNVSVANTAGYVIRVPGYAIDLSDPAIIEGTANPPGRNG